jgi:hypothetical protein
MRFHRPRVRLGRFRRPRSTAHHHDLVFSSREGCAMRGDDFYPMADLGSRHGLLGHGMAWPRLSPHDDVRLAVTGTA